ncbi:hypothetical protein COCSADRAFT_104620, partial [Bipolaris sorokiniana ND90Pr]
ITAFKTKYRLFKYIVMLFRLTNALATVTVRAHGQRGQARVQVLLLQLINRLSLQVV